MNKIVVFYLTLNLISIYAEENTSSIYPQTCLEDDISEEVLITCIEFCKSEFEGEKNYFNKENKICEKKTECSSKQVTIIEIKFLK